MEQAEVLEVVRQVITSILPALPACEVREDRQLKELGADSVERTEIILLLKECFGVPDPMQAFADLSDIGALVRFLCSRTRTGHGEGERG